MGFCVPTDWVSTRDPVLTGTQTSEPLAFIRGWCLFKTRNLLEIYGKYHFSSKISSHETLTNTLNCKNVTVFIHMQNSFSFGIMNERDSTQRVQNSTKVNPVQITDNFIKHIL